MSEGRWNVVMFWCLSGTLKAGNPDAALTTGFLLYVGLRGPIRNLISMCSIIGVEGRRTDLRPHTCVASPWLTFVRQLGFLPSTCLPV